MSDRGSGTDPEPWFSDRSDARAYAGQVGRVWAAWLVGLAVLAFSDGIVTLAVGIGLVVVVFVLMQPLQHRVEARFHNDPEARRVTRRSSLSARDRALRELAYGREPAAEAVATGELWPPLAYTPWLVIALTLAAGAAIAVSWLGT